eukprot:1340240-Amorphochlora_amoeboformis.AAC.2
MAMGERGYWCVFPFPALKQLKWILIELAVKFYGKYRGLSKIKFILARMALFPALNTVLSRISGLVITVGGLGATLLAAYSSLDSMKDVIPYHAGATAILEPTTPRISWYKSVRKITERTPKAYPEFAALKPAEKCVERPSRLYNDAKVGFVIGAFNHYASSNRFFGAVSAIESLVKIGGWGGK